MFRLSILAMAITDIQRGPRDADGRRRHYTAEELDALAEFEWPWAGVMGALSASVTAMRSRVRPRARKRIGSTALPSVEATAQV